MSIEELMQVEVPTVFGASKYQQTIEEAPAAVTVITAQEIKAFGYRHLGEVLQSVRGLSVVTDRNYHFLGIRGFSRPGDYNTRVLLLLDGIRVNDNIYDQAAVGTDFPLDIDLIDRVEIVRGPSHSLYGSNAFFGVINVISRRGRELKGAELSAEGGSYDTYKGRISFGGSSGSSAAEVLASASLLNSVGQELYYREFDTPDQNNGRALGADGEHFSSAFIKTRYKELTLEGGYIKRRKNLPTAPYGTVFNTPQTQTVDTRVFLDLKYEHQLENQLGVMARATYTRYRFDGDYLYDTGTNSDLSQGGAAAAEIQLTKELFQRHKIVAGGEYRNNFRQNQKNFDATTVYLDDRRHSSSWALFIQDEYTLFDNLVLHAGVRYDHYSNFGSTVNPRAALVYTPLADTTIKLLYGSAFRAPNVYELYYSDANTTMRANTHIREERITTFEAILSQNLNENLTLSMYAFYNQMKDVISQQLDSAGLLYNDNIDSYQTRGLESELIGRWQCGAQGRLSYTYQEARRSGASAEVYNSPRHLAKLNLMLPLIGKNLFLGLEEQYTGTKKTLAGTDTSDFFVTNLTLYSREFLKGLEVSASVYTAIMPSRPVLTTARTVSSRTVVIFV